MSKFFEGLRLDTVFEFSAVEGRKIPEVDTPKRLGGIIPYIGIHPVDLIRWTTGLDFQTVAATQGRTGGSQEMPREY